MNCPLSKIGGDIIGTGRSGDQTWSWLVKFDNETVEKQFFELVWNRSVLKEVVKQFSKNNPFN